jgi:hypothetical protein
MPAETRVRERALRSTAWRRRFAAAPCRAAALTLALIAQACSGEDVVLADGPLSTDGAAPRDTGTEPDATVGVPAFSEPAAIAAIAAEDAKDDDPSLSADLTLLYFNSEREGGAGQEDIWLSTRDSSALPWSAPEPAAELNTEVRETGIALAPEALAIWWSSDREGGAGGLDVYTATRASRGAAWSVPQRVAELSSGADDLISAVSDGGRSVLLARRTGEDDDYDLFMARRDDPAQPWGEPLAIAELNSDDEESDAFPLAGGAQLLFTRDEDLQLARRERESEPFGQPEPLDTLNSDEDDRDAWASEDFGYVVFSSDRSGSYLLYEAERLGSEP